MATSTVGHFNIARYQSMVPPNIKLETFLGSGSFSAVFKARVLETDEVLGVKCLRKRVVSKNSFDFAVREIAVLLTVKHPNIVNLKIYEVNKAFIYMGTEFIDGGTLRQYVDENKPLPECVVKHVMIQVLSAVTYIHELGVLHGDIKLENILCVSSKTLPTVKLCDFGLSDIKLKDDGCFFYTGGSFFYMAPEIHLKTAVDLTCDLWSCGVVMYNLLFDRPLFREHGKPQSIFLGNIRNQVKPNFDNPNKYSPECMDLLKNLLIYDKHKRLKGKSLQEHQFLNINAPLNYDDEFVKSAQIHLSNAVKNFNKKDFGEALVCAMQGVLELKIHCNLVDGPDHNKFLKNKIEEYSSFIGKIEEILSEYSGSPTVCPESCSDTEFRKYLESTPKLLEGFDIGYNAEMFLKEGKKEKALTMLHEAVQVVLPLMKAEPQSNRKTILGNKLKKWIMTIEALQK